MNGNLQIKEVHKSYQQRQILKGVSLFIECGEVIGLLGPNGAGKTTCFHIVVGLIPCDQGEILLNDRLITHVPIHGRARLGIGYLPQESSIFRKLTVRENIYGVLEMRQDIAKKERESLTQKLLEDFRLTHLIASQGMNLSGGERRRLEIARLMALSPQLILLDEPFAGVDPLSVAEIQTIIKDLKSHGIGVLITDHNVRETLGICDRAYIIHDGKVLIEGNPQTILQDDRVKAVYLGEGFRL